MQRRGVQGEFVMGVRPEKDAYQESVGRNFAAGTVFVCCGTHCKPFRGSETHPGDV